MSEAKPQDGSTVKGYRTLTAGDIERMNRLKGVSRHFCSLLDTERGELLAVRNGPAMLSAEQAREIDEAMRSLAIARTKMQEACMWACRAVARATTRAGEMRPERKSAERLPTSAAHNTIQKSGGN